MGIQIFFFFFFFFFFNNLSWELKEMTLNGSLIILNHFKVLRFQKNNDKYLSASAEGKSMILKLFIPPSLTHFFLFFFFFFFFFFFMNFLKFLITNHAIFFKFVNNLIPPSFNLGLIYNFRIWQYVRICGYVYIAFCFQCDSMASLFAWVDSTPEATIGVGGDEKKMPLPEKKFFTSLKFVER